MTQPPIGIIGGTGLGDVLAAEGGVETVQVDTPFGSPSAPIILANWEGVDVAFLSRHGNGHKLNPTSIPYRANIWALKTLGVEAIFASGATGSLREEIKPGHLVIADQVIDKTRARAGTFFDEGLVAHVELADPFCPRLGALLRSVGAQSETTVHAKGTYVCMEGPQFSTRAESHMHRQWGGDLIGMTCMPEAKLAREAEMCYALVALPTDFDCWRPHDEGKGQEALLAEIIGNLRRATEAAVALMRQAVRCHADATTPCHCRNALKMAIWTDRSSIDPVVRERLGLLIDRYLTDNSDG